MGLLLGQWGGQLGRTHRLFQPDEKIVPCEECSGLLVPIQEEILQEIQQGMPQMTTRQHNTSIQCLHQQVLKAQVASPREARQ